jgi:CDP-6-deoxy-D-xylo-4-hexulose-3-dehydrase
LWLIEDNCDALGCRYTLSSDSAAIDDYSKEHDYDHGPLSKYTGSWGDLSTQSFYPPHHLTMGEGGAVNVVRQSALKVIIESFRDWGRDCWCPSGKDNTCNKRFGWQLGELPQGYDHKYIYSHLGYNLKPLDLQAAIGLKQLDKLPAFIEARKRNWELLRRGLAELEDVLEFSLPTHATGWDPSSGFTWDASGCRTECSWFGFKISIRPNARFSRTQLAEHLDEHLIGNRMLFGGNLLRQPAFAVIRKESPERMRIVGDLAGADRIMNDTLFIGTFPGLTDEMIEYMVNTIVAFCRS